MRLAAVALAATGCFGIAETLPEDVDLDHDGVRDTADNCPELFNPDQGDRDGDHLGNICDQGARYDYSGDLRGDPAVYRPSTGTFYIFTFTGQVEVELGPAGAKPLMADFDGDGRADPATFLDGAWHWFATSTQSAQAGTHGEPGDIPVAADYDGDGIADLAVYHPATGAWSYVRSTDGDLAGETLGGAAGDTPVVGDWSGDGYADFIIFREGGSWLRLDSRTGESSDVEFGVPGDIPVAADWDGDRRLDPAVWRPTDQPFANFYYSPSAAGGGLSVLEFGIPGDIPIPMDFNGDAAADVMVYRPAVAGTCDSTTCGFYARTDRFEFISLGTAGDIVVQRPYF